MHGIWLVVVSTVGACSFHGAGVPAIDATVDPSNGDGAQVVDGRVVDSAAPPDAPVPHSCGAGYVSLAGAQTTSTYKAFGGALWQAAKARCESDTAHLVIPETTAEAVAVYNLIDPATASPYYWAGISDQQHTNTWVTVFDQPISPHWGPGQPNLRPIDTYVLVSSNGDMFDWNDAGQEFACECAPF
ncbi:MAG: C-type lectin domain-containing protein [Proteobacteria bacterium]|nr:C-type lectin domain-containing protein [Pseudomonadota bacterium]